MAQWLSSLCRAKIPVYLGCISILLSGPSISGELLELAVREKEGEYSLRIVVVMNAPADYVYQVITDYRNAYRINPAITSVKILPAERDDVTRVVSRSTHYVGMFAFEIEWAGDVVERRRQRIDMTTVPKYSSFESGFSLWEISPQGDQTWVLHESTLKPKFFVPPLIGTYLVKKHMNNEALTTFHHIECHARSKLERDMQADPKPLKVVMKKEKDRVDARRYEAGQIPVKR
jgi:uncharacterized membrane protein